MRKTLLEYLVKAHKVGDFTLTSGIKSDFYIDVKSLMFNARFIALLGQAMFRYIDSEWHGAAVGGMELGSVPISTAIAIKSTNYLVDPVHHFVVRKVPKGHGMGAQIEGFEYIKDKPVVIVDDVLTTGGSIIKTADVLTQNGISVVGAVVVVDRMDMRQPIPFPVHALFTKKDILSAI